MHANLLAANSSSCSYVDSLGTIHTVTSIKKVPQRYRKRTQCWKPEEKRSVNLAKPQDIKLKGNTRKQSMSSALGRINLRWPRKVEDLFGSDPVRAVASSATTASRAIKQASFPTHIRSLRLNWNMVFLDEELPEQQIPEFLVSNCHPAWMTAPANIYVVAQRVAAGCGQGKRSSKSVADAELVRVLLHEIGHVVEHKLLKSALPYEPLRSEGFAAWFEAYAADFSAKLKLGSVKSHQLSLTQKQRKAGRRSLSFRGTGKDYAYSAAYFHFLVDRRGVSGLLDAYDYIQRNRLGFLSAFNRQFAWTVQEREAQFDRYLKSFE